MVMLSLSPKSLSLLLYHAHILLCFSIVSSAVPATFFADSAQNSAHVARTDWK
jgi:hypothetical protein